MEVVKVLRGFRGKEYADFVHQRKEELNWTCQDCSWQAMEKIDRVNLIAHLQGRHNL